MAKWAKSPWKKWRLGSRRRQHCAMAPVHHGQLGGLTESWVIRLSHFFGVWGTFLGKRTCFLGAWASCCWFFCLWFTKVYQQITLNLKRTRTHQIGLRGSPIPSLFTSLYPSSINPLNLSSLRKNNACFVFCNRKIFMNHHESWTLS